MTFFHFYRTTVHSLPCVAGNKTKHAMLQWVMGVRAPGSTTDAFVGHLITLTVSLAHTNTQIRLDYCIRKCS